MQVISSDKKTISPGEVRRAVATASSREPIYVDYLLWLSESGARRVIIALFLGLCALELVARWLDPVYSRTAVSSLHGIRAIFQQAEEDSRRKYLAFGDSTLVGGGIEKYNETVLGHLASSVASDEAMYNLAVPSGDSVTSALLLERLAHSRVTNVAGVIIEVLPSKFINLSGLTRMPANRVKDTVVELEHMVPNLSATELGVGVPPLSFPERVEVSAQWQLANTFRLFRHRDWARTEIMGNYPVFWAIGALLPKSMLRSVFSSKADGANRLGANLKDADFDPAHLKKADTQEAAFAPEDQSTYIRRSIATARLMGAKPLLICFPMHVEAYDVSPATRRDLYRCVDEFEAHIQQLAREESADILWCPSKDFQDPQLWTKTPAHFNARGAQAISEYVKSDWMKWKARQP